MLIQLVSAEDCYKLRESILRPGQPKENWTFESDGDSRTIHLAMKNGDNNIVGVVSLLPEAKEGFPWRLRGMAVQEENRREGIGQELLNELCSKVCEGIWCSARKRVQEFYLKNGFETFGEEFMMNDMTHVYMGRR